MTIKPTCVSTGVNICAIYLNETTAVPSTDIEAAVQLYMANAVATLTAQPTGVGIKRFVYVKGPIS